MASPSEDNDRTVVGTFAEPRQADLAAEAARKADFQVERGTGGEVVLHVGGRPRRLGEAEGILAAYGAREFGGRVEIQEPLAGSAASATTGAAARARKAGQKKGGGQHRVRAEEGAKVELVEEQLRARTRPVQTGEVTIRKEVVTETRALEVPVRREELIIERTPVERHPFDARQAGPSDPLVEQLVDRLRHMQSGEVLRIPIVEEEVVVHKRPVVVEEVTLGKRVVEDSQTVSDTVRREEARIEEHGDVRVRGE